LIFHWVEEVGEIRSLSKSEAEKAIQAHYWVVVVVVLTVLVVVEVV
jgi:hypothetical protein